MLNVKRLLFVALSLMSWTVMGQSQHRAEIVEQYPQGEEVLLQSNEKLYFRIEYSTPSMTQIFIRPYYKGEEVQNVSNSPSPIYKENGETIAWFSFPNKVERVDEVRVWVGNSKRVLSQRYPVSVLPSLTDDTTSPRDTLENTPKWVKEMQQKVFDATGGEPQPLTNEDEYSLFGFMAFMWAVALFGILAPLWGVKKWNGGYRKLAFVPLVWMGLFVSFMLITALIDHASLGLWPFTVILASLPSGAMMIVLFVVRFIKGVDKGSPKRA